MLSSLANTAVKNKKIAPMMESFFTAFVLPEFKSPHGHLRYRVRRRCPSAIPCVDGLTLYAFAGMRGRREVRVVRYEVGKASGERLNSLPLGANVSS
jgi:hypothetical protein